MSRTICGWASSSAWTAAVLAGAPSPLRSNACWPSRSDSRSSRSLMCWASRRFCSCRLAFSASAERWLMAVAAGDGSLMASADALSTAACRSGWRWMNERWTAARAATAETVISEPSACMLAIAWWTRCRRRSASRRRARASGVPGVVIACSPRLGRGRLGGGHSQVDDLPGLADHGDRLGDAGLVLLAEVADIGFDAADQPPQLGDLLIAWSQLCSRPLLQASGGPEAFPVGEQLLQVGLQLGQVGRVAAEVTAAQAGELVRAGLSAGLDVGWLGAGAEGDRHLADPHPGVLVGQQPVDPLEDAAALPVELVMGDPA